MRDDIDFDELDLDRLMPVTAVLTTQARTA